MRYPWKDTYGTLLEPGNIVQDLDHDVIGFIELNSRGIPCIHVTMKYHRSSNSWETLDNKGPIEAYQLRLFNEQKSKFYWWRHQYQLSHIIILQRNIFEDK